MWGSLPWGRKLKINCARFQENLGNDAKMYKREINLLCKFFLAWIKPVPNCLLFWFKIELCHYFHVFYLYFKVGKNKIHYIVVAFIDVWQSFYAHTCCQIQFILFCPE